jgi:hypothetical protein
LPASCDVAQSGLEAHPQGTDLFFAIELIQAGRTDLLTIATVCDLPLDTVEEIAAAHARNKANELPPEALTPTGKWEGSMLPGQAAPAPSSFNGAMA